MRDDDYVPDDDDAIAAISDYYDCSYQAALYWIEKIIHARREHRDPIPGKGKLSATTFNFKGDAKGCKGTGKGESASCATTFKGDACDAKGSKGKDQDKGKGESVKKAKSFPRRGSYDYE